MRALVSTCMKIDQGGNQDKCNDIFHLNFEYCVLFELEFDSILQTEKYFTKKKTLQKNRGFLQKKKKKP